MTIDELARELLDCYGSEGQRGLARLVRRKELEAKEASISAWAECRCEPSGGWLTSRRPLHKCARCIALDTITAELASLEEGREVTEAKDYIDALRAENERLKEAVRYASSQLGIAANLKLSLILGARPTPPPDGFEPSGL